MPIEGGDEFEHALKSMEYHIITHIVRIESEKHNRAISEMARREIHLLRIYADQIEKALTQ